MLRLWMADVLGCAVPAVWIIEALVIRFCVRVCVSHAACGDDVDWYGRPVASDASPSVGIGSDQLGAGVPRGLTPVWELSPPSVPAGAGLAGKLGDAAG